MPARCHSLVLVFVCLLLLSQNTGQATPLTGVTLRGSSLSPQPAGATVMLSATPTGGSAVLYWFRLGTKSPTGIWRWETLQRYSTTATCLWRPLMPGGYTLVVLAREVGMATPVNSVLAFTILPALSGVRLAVDAPSPRAVGLPVTLTAAATGGVAVHYQFRLGYLLGTTLHWDTLRSFGTEATYRWTPAEARDYRLVVLARDARTLTVTPVYTQLLYTVLPAARLVAPPAAKLYHGVFPGGPEGTEDDATPAIVQEYETLAGAPVAWVYCSHNWWGDRRFPAAMASWIRARGAVPFIRLMLRSDYDSNHADAVFNPTTILRGDFDADLRLWARAAAQFATPVIVEYGTECNGWWFSWNGYWNGQGTKTGFGDPTRADGPERFVAVYRHLVELMRDEGANNITWVWHVAWLDDPEVTWNRLENYYPGDDVVDWVGVSLYGAGSPIDEWTPPPFREQMDSVYPRLTALAPTKPVMLCEFGSAAGHPAIRAEEWTQAAFTDLFAARWPRVAGFSWWNSHWPNDEDPAHDSIMRLQELPALAAVFRSQLTGHASAVVTRPLFAPQ
jgi:hypothetical protein